MSTPPGTPFPYDDYEEYFKTPDVGNIDDALNAPAVDPGSYGATNDANATAEWTYSEEEIFQNSLAEHGFSHPQLFEVISARLPGKTAGQVKEHFDALVQAGCIQIPDNSVPRANSSEGTSQGRQKWTEEEHNLFLRGLAQCGKGGWRIISRDFVKTKTPSQVASHAQKYYMRMNSFTPPMRRRYSLNDTRIVNSEIVQYPTRGP